MMITNVKSFLSLAAKGSDHATAELILPLGNKIKFSSKMDPNGAAPHGPFPHIDFTYADDWKVGLTSKKSKRYFLHSEPFTVA